VHRGGVGSFAATASSWALPDYGTLAFSRFDQPDSTGHPASFVWDLDGDGFEDLVIATVEGDANVGRTHWKVHRGSASGFGSATTWSIPAAPTCAATLDGPDNAFDCDGDGPADFNYALRDLDGDGKADLVISVGSGLAGWGVGKNTGTGFAALTTWSLPPSLRTEDLVVPYATPSTWTGCYAYGLYDLTGEGREDLVIADDCTDQDVGVTHWNVYAGGSAGFAADPLPFALPAGYDPDAFDHPERPSYECSASSEDFRIGVHDADGDGQNALVIFEDCADPIVGTTAWRMFPAGCLD
jgi:hypothetical protein